jgi:hypothetical protein
MTLPYRIARGLAVVVAIVVAHFVIVWLFQNMKLRAPDLGPVFATIVVDEPEPPAPPPEKKPAPKPDR